MIITGLFATVFGISGLTLSAKKVRPTTMAFANTIYKLVTTVIGSFVYPTNVPLLSWCGYCLSFLGFLTYTLGRIKIRDAQEKIESEVELLTRSQTDVAKGVTKKQI